jgi:hypothetical protein
MGGRGACRLWVFRLRSDVPPAPRASFVPVVAMQRDAKQLMPCRLAREAVLRIDSDLDGRQVERSRRTRGQPVEIRRPGGTDKLYLREMHQQPVADMRLRVAHLLLKEGPAVVRNREALPDIEAIFVWGSLRRIPTPLIEPLLRRRTLIIPPAGRPVSR